MFSMFCHRFSKSYFLWKSMNSNSKLNNSATRQTLLGPMVLIHFMLSTKTGNKHNLEKTGQGLNVKRRHYFREQDFLSFFEAPEFRNPTGTNQKWVFLCAPSQITDLLFFGNNTFWTRWVCWFVFSICYFYVFSKRAWIKTLHIRYYYIRAPLENTTTC